jgi:hypothetical protein
VEHFVSHLLGTAVPVCRCNDTMVLIFIPNIFLIIFITHDIKVKTVDEQPFIFDEFLTLFVKSLGSRVVVDYLSSKSPQSLTESAFQAYMVYLGAGNHTQGPPKTHREKRQHRHKIGNGHTRPSCTHAHQPLKIGLTPSKETPRARTPVNTRKSL